MNAEVSQLGARSVTARAYGKINVFLSVGPQRADGYHDLVSVFQSLDLAETITLAPAAETAVTLTGPRADTTVPLDSRNLAVQAVAALSEATQTHIPVAITIDKQVPVAGGMGGGSADAAAALVAYAELIGCDDAALLTRIAGELGADVPFALTGGTAIGTGRGDELVPVTGSGAFHWVLATSVASLSTPEVYRTLDELRRETSTATDDTLRDPDDVVTALTAGDPHTLAGVLHNDMTDAAIELLPGIAEVMDSGLQAGALAALVSGSGPTVGFLVADPTHALDLTVLLEATRGVRDVVRTTAPAGGAHLVTG